MYQFVHIPKAGGATIYNLTKTNGEVLYVGHKRAADLSSFAIVRNPYERLVSAFFYLQAGGGQTEIDLSFQAILSAYSDFRHFALNIAEDDLIDKIVHIRPMSYFLCDDIGNVVVNKILKIEYPNEIDEFLSEIGIEEKFTELKENKSEHEHYLNYLDPDIINEINRLYSLDFELFNYLKL